jgi:hypothetical protein
MYTAWMKLTLDAARLGYEAQTVMTLRMLKLARGGKAAEAEAQRMMTEKGAALAEAAATLATGGSKTRWSAASARASTRTGAVFLGPARPAHPQAAEPGGGGYAGRECRKVMVRYAPTNEPAAANTT